MVKQVNVQTVGTYGGHSVSPVGKVVLTLKSSYIELANYIQLIQMLNNDVIITVKYISVDEPKQLGMFRVNAINVNHDGVGTLKFDSLADYVEMDNISEMVFTEKGEEFKINFECEIEMEDAEEGDDDEWDEET